MTETTNHVPKDLTSWVDAKEMPFGILLTATVAEKLAERVVRDGGPQLFLSTAPGAGVPSRPLMHPALADAVRRWCDDMPSILAEYIPDPSALTHSMAEPVSERVDASAQLEDSSSATEEKTPCASHRWCQGHDSLCPESDGAHFTEIAIGEYECGRPKTLYAHRYESEESGQSARWVFSMPEREDWSFGLESVDGEIARGVDELLRARDAIRAFMREHGREVSS